MIGISSHAPLPFTTEWTMRPERLSEYIAEVDGLRRTYQGRITVLTGAELDYLPWLNTRFTAQYVAYTKFNGASSNYDGSGRGASDNNTLYLLAWLVF